MRRLRYTDRADAGHVVLAELAGIRGLPDVLVLGLARGGVPVAAVIAAGLGAHLDVLVVRKLGTPGHEELAMGAITRDRMVLNAAARSGAELDAIIDRERRELLRREDAYRGGRTALPVAGRTVILVDDGVATGASMRVAALEVHAAGAARIIVAVPTAPIRARAEFAMLADEFICADTPRPFQAVGLSYRDFSQVSDEQVCALLAGRH